MSCYHPIDAWKRGKDIRFEQPGNNETAMAAFGWEKVQIPCGQCIGCRLEYSRQWAIRIVKEAEKYKQNYFVTLTYDPQNVPLQTVVNEETGEVTTGMTLVKKDMQNFMKRLRRKLEYEKGDHNIRFYGCGEYGSEHGRPHYHICIMNLQIPMSWLKEWKKSPAGMIYQCEEIEKLWGKGFITVGAVTWESAAYVARYMMKKAKGKEALWEYKSQGKAPEFTLMSRKPGIAREWYEEHKNEIYKNDEMFIPKKGGARKVKPPRYYDKLFDIENPERMAEIKRNRKQTAVRKRNAELAQTTAEWGQILKAKEHKQEEKCKKLIRTID